MGPQRRLKIYVGYESSSIIKYLEPITGDLFTARFADCHFDEIIYPTLGGKNKQLERKIDWNALSLSPLDFRTNKCELEVQRIIHLQNIANQLPDAFTDLSRITKSQIPAANAPIRVDVPIGQLSNANESKPHLKRGRPIGSKDKNPKKRRANDQNNHNMKEGTHEEQQHITIDETSEKVQGTILKFTISEFALISGLKCTGNIEEHLYTHSSKSVLMAKYFSSSKHTVKKCIFVQRFKVENFDNNTDALNMSILYFIHNFLFSQVRDATISRSNFVMVEDGSTITERVGNVIPRIFNWKVVGIKVKYEKFMGGMFNKFVYTNLRSTHEEVQRLNLPTIDGVELNNDESALSHDTYPDHSERLDAPTLTPSSSGKSGHQDSSDQKWNKLKFFLQSYDDELGGFTTGVPSIDNFEEMNIVTSFKDNGKKDFEGFSSDVGTSTLDAQVEEMVNQKLEDFETATLNALVDAVVNQNPDYSKIQNPMTENIHEDHSIDAIMQGSAASVDDIPLEVVKPVDETLNFYSLSDSQIPSNYPDSVVVAHLAHIDVIFYHLRKKSKLRKNQEYRFTTTNCFFKNYVEKTYRRYYPNDSDTVHSTQQDYAESVVVADNENAVNNIIKGFSIPAGLPWHLVDEVYVLMNCNQNFHWVLAIIDLKDRRICVYDSLSNLRNMDLFPEIHKLAVMLPTFSSDSGFFEKKFRTDWPNLDAYRDKLSDTTQLLNTNSFEVEYVQNIIQQDCDSLDCGVFVAGYAEYISEGMSVPSVDFKAAYHRMQYASLLRNYDLRKAKNDYVSENEDPPRPKPTKHSIPDEMIIVRIG
ncbi:hypothetical protein T459_15038 [Capsicum annuum]|uniref:Ubiquitin-like protease family profile domain-containing protein n=1 Tax=Capsicum annuum TaxID=4072 RepID=A0A2G2ZJ56_CAPAN|nr:hypothetical protein T459_15038 [Capsicum annuum]